MIQNEQREEMLRVFQEQMQQYAVPFSDDEYLTPGALYALASIGGNKRTIPFIEIPENLDIDEALTELAKKYIDNTQITDLAKEVTVAIEWMQKSTHCLMINEVTFFYTADSLPATAVLPSDDNTKFRLAHRYKTSEIIGALGFFKWLNKPLEKEEVLAFQNVQVIDVLDKFKDCDSVVVSLFIEGELKYNCVFIDNDGAVVKYDEINGTIEEKAGYFWLQEILKVTTVNDEFNSVSEVVEF